MIKYIVIAVFFLSWLFIPLDHDVMGSRGVITPEENEGNKIWLLVMITIGIVSSIYGWLKKNNNKF